LLAKAAAAIDYPGSRQCENSLFSSLSLSHLLRASNRSPPWLARGVAAIKEITMRKLIILACLALALAAGTSTALIVEPTPAMADGGGGGN
jgi:hypothetical protein